MTRIRCTSCQAESYNDPGKTVLHCGQCYAQLQATIAAITIERNDLDDTRQGLEAELVHYKATLASEQTRCRTNAQRLIALVGAEGPMSLEDVVERVEATLAEREAERGEAERSLLRKGYRKECDMPACNCGPQWNHGGHAETRLDEIDRALPWVNGQTILMRVDNLVAENANLTAERDEAVAEVARLREEVRLIRTRGGSGGSADRHGPQL